MLKSFSHIIFSDGSSLGNPGRGGFGTVIIHSHRHVTELGGNEKDTTNNRMELTGLLEGLKYMKKEEGSILCCTDSKYVIDAITKWSIAWKKNGWITTAKTPVLNKDLLTQIDELVTEYKDKGGVHFKYVPGHVGIAGNERCDLIATTFASGDPVELFNGNLSDYAVDILNIGVDENEKEKKAKLKKKTGPAYSYLSLVDGVAARHSTWPECENRVKGKSGVKYKKALSKDDEDTILKSWGAKI